MGRKDIPAELQSLPQWVVASSNKLPLDPRSMEAASVIDPKTWATFQEACLAETQHIGFVLTREAGYTIIDLDQPRNEIDGERHQKILGAFDTYIERSQSGNGYHIICRGTIPEGARRDKVEVYSEKRYMITTGNVFKDRPINDCQALLDQLYSEVKKTSTTAQPLDAEEIASDESIVEKAMYAYNGPKFNQLCQGRWQEDYPSQSEADLALLSILAFYTKNNEQVFRLFRMSALGKREKATKNDTYLSYCIKRVRASQPQDIDLGKIKAQIDAADAPMPILTTPRPITFPKGLVGEIAEYFLHQSTRPVPEIALAGALAYFAGIVGRSYNISRTGLNQYILLLAKTGTGKEGIATGIEALSAAIRPRVPMIDRFMGPAVFASGQSLIRALDEAPCFASILGEFGTTLQTLSDPRANAATVMLKKVLLDLYTKSGSQSILRPSVYADSTKNTKMLASPCVTILGECTPASFFDHIGSSQIEEGLVPRFLVIEYMGERPHLNAKGNLAPPADLVEAMVKVTTQALLMENNRSCHTVTLDPTAQVLLDGFNLKADDAIRAGVSEVSVQLWNRAHLKALRLAALVAVGMDIHNPVVNEDSARWAIRLVEKDVTTLVEHFVKGDVGQGDAKQIYEVKRLIAEYYTTSIDKLKAYAVTRPMHTERVVPMAYLQRRGYQLSAFKNDRLGAGAALKRTVEALLDSGELQELPKSQQVGGFPVSGRAFVEAKQHGN